MVEQERTKATNQSKHLLGVLMNSNSWNRFRKKPEMCSEGGREKVYKVKNHRLTSIVLKELWLM